MKLLSLEEAANLLGISVATLRFWRWKRKIEVVKVGRSVRIREDVLHRMIEANTVPAIN